ncbi:MAG: universal stress protein [Candidatus Rokubacteria bacterium]|nr:universal stress protein [Candidatus Rokubacteria bacterium]
MYKRALIPLDGSPLAEAVIPLMLDIAGPLDMEIVLLTVVRPIPPQTYESSRSVVIDDADTRMREAHDELRPVAGRLSAKGIRVTTRVRYGQPAEEIVAAAHAEGADLIAMSTHGRSGLGRLLFGSVAESVLREADVPVFLMRMTESAVASASAAGGPR